MKHIYLNNKNSHSILSFDYNIQNDIELLENELIYIQNADYNYHLDSSFDNKILLVISTGPIARFPCFKSLRNTSESLKIVCMNNKKNWAGQFIDDFIINEELYNKDE